MTLRPCIVCGTPAPSSRCDEHALPDRRGSASRRGYDKRWRALSTRARRLQPFCSDCGAVEDLTVDHSEEAWQRHEAGLAVRLEDVEVVCRGCNSRRGQARPRGEGVSEGSRRPARQAKSASHTPGGIS